MFLISGSNASRSLKKRGAARPPTQSASQYSGFFAEFYDILHSSYDADIPTYLDLADKHAGPVLELGCGTGRMLIPLARAGHQITGIDASQDMLDICRERLAQEDRSTQDRVTLVQGDIRSFHLPLHGAVDGPPRKFGLIIAVCNTILHCLAPRDLLAVMAGARQHLAADGVFVVDFFIPNIVKMLEFDGVTETLDLIHPTRGTRIVDNYTFKYDLVNQVETYRAYIEEWDGGEMLRSASLSAQRAFYFPREVALALEASGFEIVKTWKGYRKGDLVETSKDMVYICKAHRTPEE